MAAGDITLTEYTGPSLSVERIMGTWTSDGAGSATGTTENVFTGAIIAFVTIPNPDGNPGEWPTDNYDTVARDADGFDVLLGAGVNRDISGEESKDDIYLGAVSRSTLAFTVSNAGAGNSGKFAVWIR